MMKNASMRSMLLGSMVFTGLAIAPVTAQQPESRQTREFIQAAGESDTFEIMEAYTALAESTDPQVTGFARQMIHDHGDTSRRLREAALGAGLEPPPMAVGAAQAPFLAALQSLRGKDFDRAYWKQQLLAHRSALVVEQTYTSTGDVPAIRQAATAALPIIQSHLTMAEAMVAKSSNGS